jgi:uncharacterized protein YndB with AHSA1/START domain
MVAYDVRTWSKAPPEQVFELVADATTWKQWAGPMIRRSWFGKEGTPPPGGVGAVRRLGAKGFATSEEITEYDPPHYLAYTILGRAPMRGYRAIVSCDPQDGGTRITWAGAFEPAIPGTGRLLAWVLKHVVGSMAKRLARYAGKQVSTEGEGSPR